MFVARERKIEFISKAEVALFLSGKFYCKNIGSNLLNSYCIRYLEQKYTNFIFTS